MLKNINLSITKSKEKLAIALLLLVYFLIKCNYLDTVPRWDAASYWGALMSSVSSTLNMTSWSQFPRIVLDTYNAYGHPSMGYYSLLVLGQLYDFPNLFMLNIINVFLAMLSIYSVYKIFRWFLPEEHYFGEVLLATAAYAMEPLFFGCSIYLNTDFPVLVFFTTGLACLLYGKYSWLLISNIFMIFSKEPGIMFWAFMVGGIFLYSSWIFLKNWRTGTHTQLHQLLPPFQPQENTPKTARTVVQFISLLVPAIAFKAFTIAQRGEMWVGGSGFKFDSNGMNCFGFNPRVIANRAGEIFVLNFHWVVASITLIALLIAAGRFIEFKRVSTATVNANTDDKSSNEFATKNNITALKREIPQHWYWGILPILSCFFIFVAFNLSYITYIIPRYVIQGGFFLLLFTLLSLILAVTSRKIRLTILTIVLILFTTQTFRTIDPLSKLAFGSAPFSEHEILQIDSAGEAVGNGFVYNSEFTAVDKLFNLMNKAMPIQPDTTIIAWNADNWYPWFYMGGVFVDPKTLNRTIDWRNTFHYNVINVTDVHAAIAPTNAFYVYMPWLSKFSNEQQELAYLSSLYTISEAKEVGFQGYTLRFYQLTRNTP